jgi:hypothetical protein
MSERVTFIDRALKGEILDLDTIDDEIDAWHASETPLALHDWLGMSFYEHAMFMKRPEFLRLVLLGRKYNVAPRYLLSALDDEVFSFAARGAYVRDISEIREWLHRTGRL